MFCQQCGAEVGAARFCRKCGAPSGSGALSTQQPVAAVAPTDYEKGFKKLFMGVAFLLIAIFPIFTSGKFWWWMLFPAVPLLAAGLGEFMRSRPPGPIPMAPAASVYAAAPGQLRPATESELPRARNTAELVPHERPSVTEDPTRLLNEEQARRD